MNLLQHFLVPIGLFALTVQSACNANDCYRQVKATAFPARPTAQDCSSFQNANPITATTTVYATTTATVTPQANSKSSRAARRAADGGQLIDARMAGPGVPVYASSCNPSAYASACSCIGITASTTVAATVTSTTTTTVTASPTPTDFVLKLAPNPLGDDLYLQAVNPLNQGQGADGAQRFNIDPVTGVLLAVAPNAGSHFTYHLDAEDYPNLIFFSPLTASTNPSDQALTCSIDGSLQLHCRYYDSGDGHTGAATFNICRDNDPDDPMFVLSEDYLNNPTLCGPNEIYNIALTTIPYSGI